MSLTPPPPPPPHRPSSSLIPSGCNTPNLLSAPRRLSIATGSSSHSLPSPNQLRQILADITKQVTNSPQSSLTSNSQSRHDSRPTPIHTHLPHTTLNTFMRPSQRQSGPVTRSRSMLRHLTPRSSITPRGTRSNTPVRDENQHSNLPLMQTPRTPFNITRSPSTRSIAAASPRSSQTESNGRHSIAPLRYRTLSSVSSLATGLSSPTTTSVTTSSNQPSPQPTPSSSTSSNLRSSLRFSSTTGSSQDSSPTTPSTPSSSINHSTPFDTSTHIQPHTLRERRPLDQVDSPSSDHNLFCDSNNNSSSTNPTTSKPTDVPSSGSLAKRRRRNPSSLGRL